jgi:hypothetical protein
VELKRAFLREDLEKLRLLAMGADLHPVVSSALATLEAILGRPGDLLDVLGSEVVDIVVLEAKTSFRCRRVQRG